MLTSLFNEGKNIRWLLLATILITICCSAIWATSVHEVLTKKPVSVSAVFLVLWTSPHAVKMAIAFAFGGLLAGCFVGDWIVRSIKTLVVTRSHHKLVERAENSLQHQEPEAALSCYLSAIRLNEKYLRSSMLHLYDLEQLRDFYKSIGDNSNCCDVEGRISALAKDKTAQRYEPLNASQLRQLKSKIWSTVFLGVFIIIINVAVMAYLLPIYGAVSFTVASIAFFIGSILLGLIGLFR